MNETLSKIADYIIRFLLGNENSGIADLIGYTSDLDSYTNYKLVIVPTDFFSPDVYRTEKSNPILPLQKWEDVPLLFGSPKIEKKGETMLLYADIIAGTFFLITRYEEIVNQADRDEHGRFPGKKSLPFRAGFLNRPIVDEYGVELRKLLRTVGLNVVEPQENFNKIYLTHDVDQIAHYRSLRGMGGALTRGLKNSHQALKAIQTYFGGIQFDPWFTFPWLFELSEKLKHNVSQTDIESIVFIKSGGGDQLTDKPLHDVTGKDFKYLFDLCRQNDIRVGLHPSYLAGGDTSFVMKEKKVLDEAFGQHTIYTRNHYLRSREPKDLQALIDSGLTDDFTLGYADVAGFRLGTSRTIKWINPANVELTSLALHPLTLMDSTLSDERYMNLNINDAFDYAKRMIDETKKHKGDLVLLWHNTSVEKDNNQYHRELYSRMINYLQQE